MNGKLEWYDNVFIDSLTMQGNIQLPGSGGGPSDYYYESQQNQAVELVAFDTWGVPVGTTNLHVTAHLRAIKVPPSATSQAPNEVNGTINFTLPFHSTRRVATPRQTMSINGHAITLERVVVTASETRLFLKSDQNLPPWDSVDALGTLDGFNLSINATTTAPGNAKQGAQTGWEIVLQESLLSKQGTWTLHFVSTGRPLGTGTATFQFSIPAST